MRTGLATMQLGRGHYVSQCLAVKETLWTGDFETLWYVSRPGSVEPGSVLDRARFHPKVKPQQKPR
jgi:hypothetical protein